MLFNSLTFVVFFLVVLAAFWSMRSWEARKNLLLVASYIFYGAWNPPFAALLFATTALDFYLGRKMGKIHTPSERRLWLVISVAVNLSMLGFFKYGNFLLENFQWVLARGGIQYKPPHLDVFLPIGISFYTFHSLSYTLDIYRGVMRPTRSLRDFTLAVSFFPQLVAGPIVRAGDFLPQLEAPPKWKSNRFLWGLVLMTLGLFDADRARRQVATLIGARANEIIFTSGGTEANNLAIRGVCELAEAHGRHIITSSIEHPSVRGAIESLEKRGWVVTRLPVYDDGIIRLGDVSSALRPDTVLLSIMTANNEIGTIQPIKEIGELVKEERRRGDPHLWFHTDAVQAAGRLPIEVEHFGCDLLSISAHKIYAPKGTGALFVRRGVRLAPQQVGGHQERERRAGTESIANIVAFGAAAELAGREMSERNEHTRSLRDRFENAVMKSIDDIAGNGNREQRLPHLSNISFRFIEGEGLLIHLDMQGVAVSTGSACSSGTLEPSPVIRALGRNEELARGAIRFSFGKDNTEDEIDYALAALQRAVESLRKLSPLSRQTVAAS